MVLAISACVVAGACSAAQDKSQAQGAAIFAGCHEALAIERDAGEAGAVNDTAAGCEAAIKSWRKAK